MCPRNKAKKALNGTRSTSTTSPEIGIRSSEPQEGVGMLGLVEAIKGMSLPPMSEKAMMDSPPSYERATMQGQANLPPQSLAAANQPAHVTQGVEKFKQAMLEYQRSSDQSKYARKKAAKNIVRDLYDAEISRRGHSSYVERQQIKRELESLKEQFQNMAA